VGGRPRADLADFARHGQRIDQTSVAAPASDHPKDEMVVLPPYPRQIDHFSFSRAEVRREKHRMRAFPASPHGRGAVGRRCPRNPGPTSHSVLPFCATARVTWVATSARDDV
jgi:hypothetical protein